MATVDQQQHLGQGTSKTPDSLPIGADYMTWGQEAVRHLLPIKPDRSGIDVMLRRGGYKEARVIDVVAGLLVNLHKEPSTTEPTVWHYFERADTAMEARLYGGPKAVIVTTTPHMRTNWEMQTGRLNDEQAISEYSSLYGKEKTPYKFKMVMFDPGPKGPDGPEGEEGSYDLGILAIASQTDRKLPLLGMKPQDWKYNFKGIPARFALMYQTEAEGDSDVRVRLNHPDGTQSAELYRYVQREPGKVHVAVRVVNVSPTGW